MDKLAIEVQGLYVSYRIVNSISLKQRLASIWKRRENRVQEFQALKNVSFQVKKGQTLGVIGPNGAGKSTLLKTLAGVFHPDSGDVTLNSDSVALLTLGAGFEKEMTGIQNIFLNGVLLGIPKTEIEKKLDEIIAFADIGDFVYKPLRTYSSGMRSRLAFAIAANVEPEILLLDEMLGVGDEEFRQRSTGRIRNLIQSDRTVVLVAHSMTTILDLCDVVLWIDKGEVKDFGEAEVVVRGYLDSVKARRAGIEQKNQDDKPT